MVCCIVAAGLIPLFWTLPLLEKVQFPFRLLPLAEFAVATAAARLADRRLIVAILIPLLVPTARFVLGPSELVEVPWTLVVDAHPDVPENLPPGERLNSWPSQWALELGAKHKRPVQVGSHTVAPVFYFPAWEVRCQGRVVPTFPEPATKLLAYEGSDCDRRLVMTSAERVGLAVSLAGLLALIAFAAWRRSSANGARRSAKGLASAAPTA